MMLPPVPECEPQRLANLHSYGVLDTPPEGSFDRITALASRLLGTPMAMVSLVDADRQWFKSAVGTDVKSTPRAGSFCAHAIMGDEPLVVPDATTDPRFRESPLVVSGMVRSYAGVPLRTREGFNIGSLCVLDSRPRRPSAAELQTLRDLGAIVVNELERRAAGAELRAAMDRAEAVERAKTQFLTSVSHELRTPLSVVLGFAELLAVPSLSAQERADAAEAIKRNGRHLLDLIGAIIDLSRIEAGRERVSPEPCDPVSLSAEVCAMLRAEAGRRGVSLSYQEPEAEGRQVSVDPVRLREMVAELVGNAIKFTENGRVCVRTGLEEETAGETGKTGLWLTVEVEDTGCGIPPDRLEVIFQPLIPLGALGASGSGSHGFGLATVRGLARLMGGDISVRSRPGDGSCFTVRLPVEEVRTWRPARAGARPSGRGQPAVLLAEDNTDTAMLFRSWLERNGYAVRVADDGEAALAAWERTVGRGERFELVILDLNMPRLDGYATARRLRAAGCECPVLALTADATADAHRRSLEAGCDEYLTKPLSMRRLVEVCGKMVARGAVAA